MLCVSMFILNAAMAAVGPQSINFTFNATDSEGWIVSSGGSIISVENGVVNVQMKQQDGGKYRADFQYQKAGTYTFDKAKDIVWAIKLTAPLPGTKNSRKMEINYKNAGNTDTWINGISGPSGSLNCADGGVIYYFNLGADGLKKLDPVQDGDVKINKIHFIMADATELTDETAKYAVDWVATFTSVNDLKSFKDWKDEQTDLTKPYHELCFRPKEDGTGYDACRNGFKDMGFEGNYKARFFAVEYFLVEDFKPEKVYSLKLTTTGSGGTYPMSVWNFPYQVNDNMPASDINTMATAVVGYAPGYTGEMNEPITTSSCVNSVWTFVVPGYKLTPLTTIGNKTLVGLFVTSNKHDADEKGFFASSANTEFAVPSFTQTGINPVVNTTQTTYFANLADAVAAANADDVLELRGDVTISGNRLEIKKALTIQGATGAEKIICGVSYNTLMVLAGDNTVDYTVTFKNLIVDGQNVERDRQLFDTNGKGKMAFDGVSVINSKYSVVTGDVKCAGSNIILSGVNSFPYGVYLNNHKRVDHQGATHTEPIKIILSADYEEDYVVVLCCSDPSMYQVDWYDNSNFIPANLYVANSGSCGHELKNGMKAIVALNDNEDNTSTLSTYDGKRANVTLNRSIACNGDYATFCVPFDVSREDLESYLGATEVLRYKRTDIEDGDAVLVFDDDVVDLQAGVPYLIKPVSGTTVATMTFKDVTIDNTTTSVADAHYRFIPVFSATTINPSNADTKSIVYLGAGNQLYWAAANAAINGFRAYFQAISGPAMAAKRVVMGRHKMPTNIDNTAADGESYTKIIRDGQIIIIRDGVEYNLMGQVIK